MSAIACYPSRSIHLLSSHLHHILIPSSEDFLFSQNLWTATAIVGLTVVDQKRYFCNFKTRKFSIYKFLDHFFLVTNNPLYFESTQTLLLLRLSLRILEQKMIPIRQNLFIFFAGDTIDHHRNDVIGRLVPSLVEGSLWWGCAAFCALDSVDINWHHS